MVFRCCVCNTAGATPCSVCSSASYCSEKCRENDERTHKLLCEKFPAFVAITPRPCPSAVLALYYPILPYGQKGITAPRFVWIDPKHDKNEVMLKPDGTFGYTDLLRYDPLEAEDGFDFDKPVSGQEFDIPRNFKKNFDLDHPVVLYMRDSCGIDGSRPNISLVECTQGDMAHRWSGPLAVYSRRAFDSEYYQDITLADFRSFLDMCKVHTYDKLGKSFRTNNYLELETTDRALFASTLLRHSDFTFKGVEITCDGDEFYLHASKFIRVDVPNEHPIFDDINFPCPPTEVSKRIELPLMIRKIRPDPFWIDQKFVHNMYLNKQAEVLDIVTNPDSDKWGCHDSGFQGEPQGKIFGRVLVVREDRLDLTAHQLEALSAYFRKVVDQLENARNGTLAGLAGDYLREERVSVMGRLVSRTKFEDFFNGFKNDKVVTGDSSWANELSPYAVIAPLRGGGLAQ